MNKKVLKLRSISRKMVGNQKHIAAQEFSEGISVLTSVCFDNKASLQDQSKEILCELLKDLAVEIATFVQSSRKKNIGHNDVIDAVKRLLTKEFARHAIAEGVRMIFLHQNEMLKLRNKIVEKAEIPIKTRKRKRSASTETSPIAKLRKKSTSKKTSLKKVPERPSRSKAETEHKLSKSRSRKRSTSKETKRLRKSSPRKRAPARDETPKRRKKTSSRKRTPTKDKILRYKRLIKSSSRTRASPKDKTPKRRKRSSSRKRTPKEDKFLRKKRLTKSSSRKRASTRDKIPMRRKKSSGSKLKPTRDETVESKIFRKKSVSSSRRGKSRTRKSPRRVSPKTIRKISKRQPTKEKMVSKKETTHEISSIGKTEIKSGIQKLNKYYKQELSSAGEKLIVQCLYNLLNYLCDEMRKSKSSSIGLVDVRRAIIKIFPPELADLAIAEMSRFLMT